MNIRSQQMRRVMVAASGVPAVLGLVTVAVLATGVAAAATNSAHAGNHAINGCAAMPGGSLRIVSAGTPCKRGEKRLVWNKAGPQGASGHSLLHGAGAPDAATGKVGDFYLNTDTLALFGPKTADGWGSGTSLVGPAGPSGDHVLSGSGSPAASAGMPGDFYVDTAAHLLYGPKASDGWPATATSLVGPAGPAGPSGATGPPGAPGTPGAPGAPGAPGSSMSVSLVHSALTNVPAGGANLISVLCPTGMVAIAGGVAIDPSITSSDALTLVTLDSFNFSLSGGSSAEWVTDMRNTSTTTDQSAETWAACVPSANASPAFKSAAKPSSVGHR